MFEERDKGRLLANLRSLPHELHDLVVGMSDDELRWRPIPNKWSIAEIIVHLRDVEREVFQVRLRQTLLEDRPVFAAWDQERAAIERDYLAQSPTGALVEFGEVRGQTAAFLDSAPVDQWQRVGIHPTRGEKSVTEMVTWQIKSHDLSHLVQIKDILRIKMPW